MVSSLTSKTNAIYYKVGDIDEVFNHLSLAIVEKFFKPMFPSSSTSGVIEIPLIDIRNRSEMSNFLRYVAEFVNDKLN